MASKMTFYDSFSAFLPSSVIFLFNNKKLTDDLTRTFKSVFLIGKNHKLFEKFWSALPK